MIECKIENSKWPLGNITPKKNFCWIPRQRFVSFSKFRNQANTGRVFCEKRYLWCFVHHRWSFHSVSFRLWYTYLKLIPDFHCRNSFAAGSVILRQCHVNNAVPCTLSHQTKNLLIMFGGCFMNAAINWSQFEVCAFQLKKILQVYLSVLILIHRLYSWKWRDSRSRYCCFEQNACR